MISTTLDYDFHLNWIDKILYAHEHEAGLIHILFGFYCADFFERVRASEHIPFAFENIEIVKEVNVVYSTSPVDLNDDYPCIYEDTLLFIKDRLLEEKACEKNIQ